jgi:Zinc dependent phospholipase C
MECSVVGLKERVIQIMKRIILLTCILAGLWSTPTPAYSVLTHEAIIDSLWPDTITPLLKQRFPDATDSDILEAHKYAYGGSIIQDMGYYPFGSKLFTDLVHYVRSADFVTALLEQSADLNEYAFALGALAHYASDNSGHAIATNLAVPMLFPKLKKEFGTTVTYAESPSAHLKTEFGFDVVQTARGQFAPQSYHDFIGFDVSKDVLKRAFQQTYSLSLTDVFSNLDLAIATYRKTVSVILPKMTRVAWQNKKDEIRKAVPGVTQRQFLYNLSRASFEKEWGKDYKKPGFFARFFGFLSRIMPKIGPFKALDFKIPTPETERMFMQSFDVTLTRYRELAKEIQSDNLTLPNNDLDTGQPSRAGEYALADQTYARLLVKLQERQFTNVDAGVRENILTFYNTPAKWKEPRKKKERVKVVQALKEFRDLSLTAQ